MLKNSELLSPDTIAKINCNYIYGLCLQKLLLLRVAIGDLSDVYTFFIEELIANPEIIVSCLEQFTNSDVTITKVGEKWKVQFVFREG